MAKQTGSIDLSALKASADIANNTEQYFWFNSQDSGAGEGAGAHITETPQDTFIADPPNGGGNVLIDSDSVDVRDGTTTLATFGASGVQIGQDGQTRVLQDYHSMKMIDKEGNEYFHVSDLRNQTGNVEETFLGDGANNAFAVGDTPTATIKVTINGVETTNYTVTDDVYTFSTAPALNAVIVIEYTPTNAQRAKAFTFGARTQNQKIGFYSCAEGFNVTAGGNYSHAEGVGGVAMGKASHSESNGAAHGDYSHGEGTSFAIGKCSHAQNNDTIAYSDDQTSLGRCNELDTNGQYAVIVGNGNGIIGDPKERDNALTVDWNGNVVMAGSAYDGTTKRLLNSGDIVAEEHKIKGGLSVNNGSQSSGTATVQKTGAYPLGIVGHRTANGSGSGGSYALPHALYISSASTGSATVSYGIRAVGGNVSNCDLYATILWKYT